MMPRCRDRVSREDSTGDEKCTPAGTSIERADVDGARVVALHLSPGIVPVSTLETYQESPDRGLCGSHVLHADDLV